MSDHTHCDRCGSVHEYTDGDLSEELPAKTRIRRNKNGGTFIKVRSKILCCDCTEQLRAFLDGAEIDDTEQLPAVPIGESEP